MHGTTVRSLAFAARRALWYAVVFSVVSFALFALLHALAGDQFAPPGHKRSDVESERAAEQRVRWGLDRPLVSRFLTWAGASVRLGFGVSIWSMEPADAYWWDAERFNVRAQMEGSLVIVGATLLLVWLLAAPLGATTGLRQGGFGDGAVRWLTRWCASFPGFLVAAGLLVCLSLAFHSRALGLRFDTPHAPYRLWPAPLLGIAARVGWQGLVAALVLVVPLLARALAHVRDTVRRPERMEALRAHEARGASPRRSALRVGLRPALRRLAEELPRDLQWLLVASIVGSDLFGWPAMGRFLASVLPRDAHGGLVLSALLWYTGLLLAAHLTSDVLVYVLSPTKVKPAPGPRSLSRHPAPPRMRGNGRLLRDERKAILDDRVALPRSPDGLGGARLRRRRPDHVHRSRSRERRPLLREPPRARVVGQ
ncbi:MAG: ABC transporter permease subunit [Candidatus Bipolaricaulota bacterium]|nr:MAG: ABC transporter permease subunit [Candidatus Bipolaricaulota bacterium]